MNRLFFSPGACSLVAHVALREVGQPFELVATSLASGAHRTAEYLAINPRGRVPALQIDGFTLTENVAIIGYLTGKHPHAGLLPPAGTEAHARAMEWLGWLASSHHIAFAAIFRSARFTDDEAAHPAIVAKGHATVVDHFRDIEARLAGGAWAAGGAYSVVDAYLLVFYRWGYRIGVDMRRHYPAWTAQAERTAARPTVAAALVAEGIEVWPALP